MSRKNPKYGMNMTIGIWPSGYHIFEKNEPGYPDWKNAKAAAGFNNIVI